MAKTSKKHKHNMVWIDMEMTGLDCDKEGVIEVACLITDSELRVLAKGPNLVIYQPPRLLKAMDDWNQKHHKESGLLDKVKKSKMTAAMADEKILRFVKRYCLPKQAPLCGNAIDQDRRFLMKHMPKSNAYLHYRNVDVSTIKALVQRWYPKNKAQPKKKDKHRALSDILESLEELKFYRETYFRSAF